jgi:hypothetical protein
MGQADLHNRVSQVRRENLKIQSYLTKHGKLPMFIAVLLLHAHKPVCSPCKATPVCCCRCCCWLMVPVLLPLLLVPAIAVAAAAAAIAINNDTPEFVCLLQWHLAAKLPLCDWGHTEAMPHTL